MTTQEDAAMGASVQWAGPVLGISLEGNLRQSLGPLHPQPVAAQAQSGFPGFLGALEAGKL